MANTGTSIQTSGAFTNGLTQAFSFSRTDGTLLTGTIKDFKVILNLLPKNFVTNQGLLRFGEGNASVYRVRAPYRMLLDDYSFTAASGGAKNHNTPVAATTEIQVNKAKEITLTREQIDSDLFSQAGEIYGQVVGKFYEIFLLYMDQLWFKTAIDIAKADKVTDSSGANTYPHQVKVGKLDITDDAKVRGNALKFASGVRKAIADMAKIFDRLGSVEKDNLIGVCSIDFTKTWSEVLAAQGLKPEYLTQDGRNFLTIDGVKFVENKFVGQNLGQAASGDKDVVSTKNKGQEIKNTNVAEINTSVDLSKVHFILLEKDGMIGCKAIQLLAKGAYFWAVQRPQDGNIVNGMKVALGINKWSKFYNRIKFVVSENIT